MFQTKQIPQQFSVSIRHDLDNLDTPMLKKLIAYETSIGIRSTLFVLADQLRDPEFNAELQTAKQAGFDIQLHSEIKRSLFQSAYIRRPISALRRFWLHVIVSESYSRKVYQKKLKAYTRALGEKSQHTFTGHAPHNKNCYLRFSHDKNWNIIEQATLQAGLSWLSDYRDIVKTAWGQPFPIPRKTYLLQNKDHSILVFPTSWDDRFTFEFQSPYAPAKKLTDIVEHIKTQIESCAQANIPCVLSLHPLYFVSDKPRYEKEVLADIKEIANQLGGGVITLQSLYSNIRSKA